LVKGDDKDPPFCGSVETERREEDKKCETYAVDVVEERQAIRPGVLLVTRHIGRADLMTHVKGLEPLAEPQHGVIHQGRIRLK